MEIHELFAQYRKDYMQKIKQALFEQFNIFESLNYIKIEYDMASLQMDIYLEFYEGQYLLETLNDPEIITNMLEELSIAVNSANGISLEFSINITNKKRQIYDKENIEQVVYCNNKPKIKYEGVKFHGLWNFFKKYRRKFSIKNSYSI